MLTEQEQLEIELLTIRKECYFARGTMPIEEWREYHPRIDALKQKVEDMRKRVLSEVPSDLPNNPTK